MQMSLLRLAAIVLLSVMSAVLAAAAPFGLVRIFLEKLGEPGLYGIGWEQFFYLILAGLYLAGLEVFLRRLDRKYAGTLEKDLFCNCFGMACCVFCAAALALFQISIDQFLLLLMATVVLAQPNVLVKFGGMYFYAIQMYFAPMRRLPPHLKRKHFSRLYEIMTRPVLHPEVIWTYRIMVVLFLPLVMMTFLIYGKIFPLAPITSERALEISLFLIRLTLFKFFVIDALLAYWLHYRMQKMWDES